MRSAVLNNHSEKYDEARNKAGHKERRIIQWRAFGCCDDGWGHKLTEWMPRGFVGQD